jgi:hypothetical protein
MGRPVFNRARAGEPKQPLAQIQHRAPWTNAPFVKGRREYDDRQFHGMMLSEIVRVRCASMQTRSRKIDFVRNKMEDVLDTCMSFSMA